LLIHSFFENNSFEGFLKTLEHLIAALRDFDANNPHLKMTGTHGELPLWGRSEWLVGEIAKAISLTEMDLGIRFDSNKGVFKQSGAKLLDERLVNEELRWLSENQYTKVYEPFEKGLRFLLEARNDSIKLQDVVTDLYEALEAFARIVCQKPKRRLGQLVDIFINELNLNQSYKKILKEYIDYACKFRHPEDDRPDYDYAEVEAFVYLTGLFIRLGIQKIQKK